MTSSLSLGKMACGHRMVAGGCGDNSNGGCRHGSGYEVLKLHCACTTCTTCVAGSNGLM